MEYPHTHTQDQMPLIGIKRGQIYFFIAGGEVVRDSAVDYVEDEYGSGCGVVAGQAIDNEGMIGSIPTSQQQQSVPQDYNPMLALLKQLRYSAAPLASSGMFSQPRIDAQTVATAQGVLDAQRRVQQAQAFDSCSSSG